MRRRCPRFLFSNNIQTMEEYMEDHYVTCTNEEIKCIISHYYRKDDIKNTLCLKELCKLAHEKLEIKEKDEAKK